MQLEYDVWQSGDAFAKNQALLKKLWYQLNHDSSYADIAYTFERLDVSRLEPEQRKLVAKNNAVFYYRNEVWEAAATAYYDYMSLMSKPSLEDSMQYYYLNRLAMGDFSESTAWSSFVLDSNRQDCILCLEAALGPVQPSKWPKYLNYVVPGSGMMAVGQWREGVGSLTLNGIGITAAALLLSSALPVNTFVWAVSWEILFYPGSQRALAKYQSEKEIQKKAGLKLECQARWEKWLQTMQYEPFISNSTTPIAD